MEGTQIAAVVALLLLPCATSRATITIDTVPVGDVGNANDPSDGDSFTSGVQNFGAVGYAYNIGKFEVTVGQYEAFLNAVAKADPYSLWNIGMYIDGNAGFIQCTGASGSYNYSLVGPSANRPVAHVNWADAARFANWLHNGQPTGAEGPGTTETGAYTLNGAADDSALAGITRNPGAASFIPTENEWYKAAYYQPAAAGGDSDGYWTYAMKTNSLPYSDQPPGATPDNTRVANYFNDDSVANGYNDGYAVTGSPSHSTILNYLTNVGAYTSSPSYFGTFDQTGNVFEWNETEATNYNFGVRELRGGSWDNRPEALPASYRVDSGPWSTTFSNVGFRVATRVSLSRVRFC